MSSRQCDWCQNYRSQGENYFNNWVCADCFPPDALEKQKKKENRTCGNCGKKRKEGEEKEGKWICCKCLPKKSRNKYAQFSKVDSYQHGGIPYHQPKNKMNNGKARKPRAPRDANGKKLKKTERWTVVIVEIYNGLLL